MCASVLWSIYMDKLVRAIAVSVVLFFVVLGLVIGSRMDQNTIALLGGTTIGLLIAAPCAAIVTYLAVRNRDESSASGTTHAPPTYYVVPQVGASSLPASPTQQYFLPTTSPTYQQTTAPFVLPPQRKFYVIGGGGEVSELLPEDEGTGNAGGLISWQNVQ
jgi:hypothetical protein